MYLLFNFDNVFKIYFDCGALTTEERNIQVRDSYFEKCLGYCIVIDDFNYFQNIDQAIFMENRFIPELIIKLRKLATPFLPYPLFL